MNTFSKLVVAAIITATAVPCLTAQTVKVGTFNRTSLIVAFYSSPQWADVLKQKEIERQEAMKANDQEKVKEIEHWGGSAQEMAERQLAGATSIQNIVDLMRPIFPDIAAKAHVSMIVTGLAYADATVERVDVTDLLLDSLKASPRTRKELEEMRKAKKTGKSQ